MRHTMLSAVMFLLVVTCRVAAAPVESKPDDVAALRAHQGRWLGDLTLPNGHVIKSGVDIFTRADGSVWASYASPDRGAYDIPVKRIRSSGDSAELELPFALLTLAWSDDHFRGQWHQNESVLPIDFRPVAEFPRRQRPQTPTPPFPYTEQTLAIAANGNVTLGATLTLPQHVRHPNVVVLVHGSGPQTRDEEGDGHRPFAVLADRLARQGIAVLRYDKRGVARSTGDYAQHTQQDLADDLSAVVALMRARKQFRRVGVIGHSEGPMLAAAVAARQPDAVDFIVSLGGVGLPGIDMMLLQDRAYAVDQGARGADLEHLMRFARQWYTTIVAQPEPGVRVAALKELGAQLSSEDRGLVEKYKMNVGTLSLEAAEDPALRDLLATDPRKDWRAVRCPVLALNGALDHQVPPQSLAGIVAALREGGNATVVSELLPSINHELQTAKTGAEDEYATIDETIAAAVVQRIVAFVARQR